MGLLSTTSSAFADEAPLLLQRPAISRTHVAFVYAGDLWLVGREGGAATRLTSGIGLETHPVFSPDGTQIAFGGEYEGNLDGYIVPTADGVPRRLTHHPAPDLPVGWTPDGKAVLFRSTRDSYAPRTSRLYTVPVIGGMPTPLPLPMAVEGKGWTGVPIAGRQRNRRCVYGDASHLQWHALCAKPALSIRLGAETLGEVTAVGWRQGLSICQR